MSQPGRHAHDEAAWALGPTTRTGRRLARRQAPGRAAPGLPQPSRVDTRGGPRVPGLGRPALGPVRPRRYGPLPAEVPRDAACAAKLAKRTLTGLYNERPTWLALAHEKLDAAVAAAYGFDDLKDEDLLARLLELNLAPAGVTSNKLLNFVQARSRSTAGLPSPPTTSSLRVGPPIGPPGRRGPMPRPWPRKPCITERAGEPELPARYQFSTNNKSLVPFCRGQPVEGPEVPPTRSPSRVGERSPLQAQKRFLGGPNGRLIAKKMRNAYAIP